MNDIERAISEISDIRSRLAASTRFHGYAPEAVATVGLISLATLVAQFVWPESLATSDAQIALVWGAVLLCGSIAMSAEAISRTRLEHDGMARAMLRGAMRFSLPISLVCFVLGGSILAFAPQTAWVLPGTWQMLIGVVAFSSYSTMPRGILWPAGMFVLGGAAVTLSAGANQAVTPLMAGGPFVLGHLWIAYVLWKEGVRGE